MQSRLISDAAGVHRGSNKMQKKEADMKVLDEVSSWSCI